MGGKFDPACSKVGMKLFQQSSHLSRHGAAKPPFQGFTLIELLIVVAIIAILAAIAVPNFLEAQTRAKISRVRGDLRTMATACNAYHIDWNKFPIWIEKSTQWWHYGSNWALIPLSTPVAYLTSVDGVDDPFESMTRIYNDPLNKQYLWVYYLRTGQNGSIGLTWGDHYKDIMPQSYDTAALWTIGPSSIVTYGDHVFYQHANGRDQEGLNNVYDASNGTVSAGSIIRLMGDTLGLHESY